MEIIEITEIKEFTPVCFQAVQKLLQALDSTVQPLTEACFREILASDSAHLFVIPDGEKTAGMLTVGIYRTPTGAKAWIEDVVVAENCRGRGLGRKLMCHAIAFARSEGMDSLMLTSRPFRMAANKLYASLGFKQRKTNVYKMTFT
jgi:ribosomal protein S18 acetylase RimI-like enzyme